MARTWSREHLERRVDRYYLLAAATKLPNLRRRYLRFARFYRQMLSMTLVPAARPLLSHAGKGWQPCLSPLENAISR